MAHEHVDSFISDFCDQWLRLDTLHETSPDAVLYPEYDEYLGHSFEMETKRFFKHLVQNDLSLMNVVYSDFSIINERLAQHYGISGVTGPKMRLVELPKSSRRGGLLTHGSVLKLTANGTDTSPILRGVWFIENIIGTPTEAPPDNTPALDIRVDEGVSLKESLSQHQAADSCVSCHKLIDPPGFAFESYDPIGKFRDRYAAPALADAGQSRVSKGTRVDPSGKTVDGHNFEDMQEYQQLLMRESDLVLKNFVNKLYTYATGRGISLADEEEVGRLMAYAKRHKYGTKTIIKAITMSHVFTHK